MPKHNKWRTFTVPQAIVMPYCHIKQLVEDCRQIMVLVNINNTTGCMIVKREPNRILYFKGYSFHSRSLWLRDPSLRPVTYHCSQFSMGTVFWSFRSLTTVRVRTGTRVYVIEYWTIKNTYKTVHILSHHSSCLPH